MRNFIIDENKELNMEDVKVLCRDNFSVLSLKSLVERLEITEKALEVNGLSTINQVSLLQDKAVLTIMIRFILEWDEATPHTSFANVVDAIWGQGAHNKFRKATKGGELAEDLTNKLGNVWDSSVKSTKKGLNKFSQWLNEKTKE